MKLLEVNRDIREGTIAPYYIFTGDEIELQRIYIAQIAETKGYSVIRADSISEIWQDITNPSLFNDNAVYVVRDDKCLLTDETLQAQIDTGALGNNILIHLLTSVDKRTKWAKQNSDRIVVFEHLSDDMLKKYIRKQITLNDANCERLIAICENDYSRILLEIDKIKCYQRWLVDEGYDNETDNSLPAVYPDSIFKKLVDDGIIYTPPKDAVFDLVDAILKRQVNRVYDLLSQCYAVGEANMVILNVLYNNAKQVLRVQASESMSNCKSLGLSKYQLSKCMEKVGCYSTGELVRLLRVIYHLQKGIVRGEIPDNLSIEYLLVNIL